MGRILPVCDPLTLPVLSTPHRTPPGHHGGYDLEQRRQEEEEEQPVQNFIVRADPEGELTYVHKTSLKHV